MSKKKVYITGASRGIGAGIARRFLAAGAEVVISSRNAPNWENAHWIQADLGIKNDAIQAANKALEILGGIDVLVNNGGLFLPGTITEENDRVFEAMMQINVASAYHTSRVLVPIMKSQNSGHVFNLCSIASETAYAAGGSYTIAKHALLGLGKVLREECKSSGVRVTNVLPGAVLTDSWAGVDLPESRFIPVEDISETIWNCYQLSSRSVIEELIIRPQLGDI
jgi:NAD(P)-dependent dehydrogenase (short-subunit alcohol dehydrogenase family)